MTTQQREEAARIILDESHKLGITKYAVQSLSNAGVGSDIIKSAASGLGILSEVMQPSNADGGGLP